MLPIRGSSAASPKKKNFKLSKRRREEDNLDWLKRQLDELQAQDEPGTLVLLLGGTSIYDFRLQFAQSQLRHDLTPSHWSHAAIISTPSRSVGNSRLLEASLEPSAGFQLPSMYNGVQGALLKRYADPGIYPNIALIRVPVDPKLWRSQVEGQKSILDQFAEQRVVVDVPTQILEWLAYVWGAGDQGNPLMRGHGIPAATVIETLIGAAGYDMCPGLDSSASSPEAFWQTAKWWQDYYDEMQLASMATRYFVADQVEGTEARGTRASGGATKKTAQRATGRTPRTPEQPLFVPRLRLSRDRLTEDLFRRRED